MSSIDLGHNIARKLFALRATPDLVLDVQNYGDMNREEERQRVLSLIKSMGEAITESDHESTATNIHNAGFKEALDTLAQKIREEG